MNYDQHDDDDTDGRKSNGSSAQPSRLTMARLKQVLIIMMVQF